jgi:hypothetical protein
MPPKRKAPPDEDELYAQFQSTLNMPENRQQSYRNYIKKRKIKNADALPTFWLDRHVVPGWEKHTGPADNLRKLYEAEIAKHKKLPKRLVTDVAYGATQHGTHYINAFIDRDKAKVSLFDPGVGRSSDTYGGGDSIKRALKEVMHSPKIKKALFNKKTPRFKTTQTKEPAQRGCDDTFCQTWSMGVGQMRLKGKNSKDIARKIDALPHPKKYAQKTARKILKNNPHLAQDMDATAKERLKVNNASKLLLKRK